ncbi:MAG: hypothetical protein COT18_03120, partial [Elusimicrobia bacterium CG08_land_8_20_14_0_20_59_10]
MGLWLDGSSSNTITQVYASNTGGTGMGCDNATDNTISFSTFTSASAGYSALNIYHSTATEVFDVYAYNPPGIALSVSGAGGSISHSTFTSNNSVYPAFNLGWAADVAIDGIKASNPSGMAALIYGSSSTVSRSTFTSAAEGGIALEITQSSSITVSSVFASNPDGFGFVIHKSSFSSFSDSEIRGSTAVFVTASTNTLISSSSLYGLGAFGSGLLL